MRAERARVARVALAVASLVTCLLVTLGVAGCSGGTSDADERITIPAESRDELERARLAAEIASIEATDDERVSATSQALRWAPFLTALVGLGALVATVRKQGAETRMHRAKELAERQAERTRRYDQTLSGVVGNLGAQDARVRLNAAAALAPLLRLSGSDRSEADGPAPPWAEAVPVEDLLPVFIANLRVESDEDVRDVLVRNLGLSLVKLHRSGGIPAGLDLTRVRARRLRIAGVTLTAADLAFSELRDADLSDVVAKRLRGLRLDLSRSRLTGANLQEARLNRSICRRTRFHRTQLVSATFKGADLSGTQFHQARLQGAHLEDATCLGCDFTEAEVADAWFCDGGGGRPAILDDSALRTLVRARHWRGAHLPPAYRRYLDELSAAPFAR